MAVAGFEAIPHEEMPSFYRSLDGLLVTSKSECHPRVVYEALAMGVHVFMPRDVGDLNRQLAPNITYLLPETSHSGIVSIIEEYF